MAENQFQTKDAQGAAAPTVAVGAQQLGQLKRHWSEYRSVTDPRNGRIDPVEALNRTGALLDAVGDVISSQQTADTQPSTPVSAPMVKVPKN
jgi:hypothetical protein